MQGEKCFMYKKEEVECAVWEAIDAVGVREELAENG